MILVRSWRPWGWRHSSRWPFRYQKLRLSWVESGVLMWRLTQVQTGGLSRMRASFIQHQAGWAVLEFIPSFRWFLWKKNLRPEVLQVGPTSVRVFRDMEEPPIFQHEKRGVFLGEKEELFVIMVSLSFFMVSMSTGDSLIRAFDLETLGAACFFWGWFLCKPSALRKDWMNSESRFKKIFSKIFSQSHSKKWGFRRLLIISFCKVVLTTSPWSLKGVDSEAVQLRRLAKKCGSDGSKPGGGLITQSPSITINHSVEGTASASWTSKTCIVCFPTPHPLGNPRATFGCVFQTTGFGGSTGVVVGSRMGRWLCSLSRLLRNGFAVCRHFWIWSWFLCVCCNTLKINTMQEQNIGIIETQDRMHQVYEHAPEALRHRRPQWSTASISAFRSKSSFLTVKETLDSWGRICCCSTWNFMQSRPQRLRFFWQQADQVRRREVEGSDGNRMQSWKEWNHMDSLLGGRSQ